MSELEGKEIARLKKSLRGVQSQKRFAFFLVLVFLTLNVYFYYFPLNQMDVTQTAEHKALRDNVTRLKKKNNSLNDQLKKIQSNPVKGFALDEIVYAVQFRSLESKVPLVSGKFNTIKDYQSSELFSYSAGVFATEAEAVQLRDQLEKIGFKDAFVVAFKQGERMLLKNLQ